MGVLRFKIEWTADRAAGMEARVRYERALLDAGREVGVDVVGSARRPGRYMTAAAIPGVVVDHVVVDGAVAPARARQLYDDATVVSRSAIARLAPIELLDRIATESHTVPPTDAVRPGSA